jgi:peptidoglycan/xylan/chitin deacetylase (PgdA/CDA1 family)
VKKSIKRVLQLLVASLGPDRLNFSSKRRLVILTYHRVLPSTHADNNYEQAGMYVRPDTFKMHMQILKDNYDVMLLSEWILKSRNNEDLPNITFAITFDDGWRDNYEYAFPILRELKIPATLFLVSDYLGTNYDFWPNRLIYLLRKDDLNKSLKLKEYSWLKLLPQKFMSKDVQSLSALQIDEIIEQCKTISDSEMLARVETMEMASGFENTRSGSNMLAYKEVEKMLDSGLFQIGSHTRHHTRLLDYISPAELADEVVNSKSILEKMFGNQIHLFCYPNGDHSEAAITSISTNYLAAVTTEHGWNDSDSNPYLLRRIGLHEDISNNRVSFISRISGL